jgi:Chaperone for flagella basal body P-ring formation
MTVQPVTMADVGGMNGRGFALPSWLRLRVVAAIALVLGCALAGASLLDRSDPGPRYWASANDLAPGTVLTNSDLTLVRGHLAESAGQYLGADRDPVGQSVTRSISAGELVSRTSVAPTAAGTTIVIALAAGNAPSIEHGQRIRLWASTATCPLATVLPDVTVQDVTILAAGGFGSGGAQRVVVRVPNSLAARVIAARSLTGVTLRAATLDGPPEAGALSDLGACQSS